jgi:23S rRNA (cytidine1920-2'-O)/16S rRNA (cytidine1409-2'-O)-methyltransferase
VRNGRRLRLDMLLVEQGAFPSREAAKRAIMAGLVSVRGEIADKPGQIVHEDDPIHVTRPEHEYVSRGGLKLRRALEVFPVSLKGRVVVDVGASTGGFTDCALQHGAAMVYAVDVGYGQLHWRLRTDPRVRVMERTNFRHVDPARFDPRPDAAVMDVSFISIRLLWSKLLDVLARPADIISLIKPQFEAGREAVGKGGIVRDPATHLTVLADIVQATSLLGAVVRGVDYSPITGGDGNIEYLMWWSLPGSERLPSTGNAPSIWFGRCRDVVREAWQALKGRDVSDVLAAADIDGK